MRDLTLRPTATALVLLSAALCLFAAAAARAEHPSVYFGGSFGEADDEVLAETSDAWKLFIGLRGRYVGTELGYHDLGDYVFDLLEQDAFSIVLTGFIPIGERFELLLRGGIGYWKVEVPSIASASGDSPTWGIGGQYAFGPDETFAVRAELERLVDVEESDVDVVSVGVQVQF